MKKKIPMARFFLGALCVAAVLWVWSTLFYVVLPIPYYTMSQTADDIAAGEALREHFPETGTYILPGRFSGDEVRKKMRREGPVATITKTNAEESYPTAEYQPENLPEREPGSEPERTSQGSIGDTGEDSPLKAFLQAVERIYGD